MIRKNSYVSKRPKGYFEYSRLQIFQDLEGTKNHVKDVKSFIFKQLEIQQQWASVATNAKLRHVERDLLLRC